MSISLGLFIVIVIGCVALGSALALLTDNFSNLDGLFNYSEDEDFNAKIDALYDRAILNEGYYKHGFITKKVYLDTLKDILREVETLKNEIKQENNNN